MCGKIIIWGAPFGNESFRENAASVKNLSATNDSLWTLLQDGSLHRYLESDDRSYDNLKDVIDMCAYGEQIFTIVKGGNLFVLGSSYDDESGLPEEEHVGKPAGIWLPLLQSPKSTVIIVQVACGHLHTVMLARYGDVYSMGDNSYGQLGLRKKDATVVPKPQVIDSLEGVPIRQIAAGGWHSFCVTASGRVFVWGRNDFGQLGLGDSAAERSFPTLLKSFADYFISFISAGEFHTALLTKTGALYTFGQGSYGQLGHGDTCANERAPKIVKELEDSTVTQVSCGRHHTIAFVLGCAQVFVFGSNEKGQLGFPHEKKKITEPVIAEGPWQEQVETCVKKVYAIGNRSFILLATSDDNSSDYRLIESNQQIVVFDENLCSDIETCDRNTKMRETLRPIIYSQSCFNGSFSVDDGMVNNDFHGIDLTRATEVISRLCQTDNPKVKKIILQTLTHLLRKLSSDPPDIEVLRLYILIPMVIQSLMPPSVFNWHAIKLLDEAEVVFSTKCLEHAFIPFLEKFLHLFDNPRKVLKKWYIALDQQTFKAILDVCKFSILDIFTGGEGKLNQSCIDLPLQFVEMLFQRNRICKIVSDKEFYLPRLPDQLLHDHFIKWKQKNIPGTLPSLCDYPFLLDATAKSRLLEFNTKMRLFVSFIGFVPDVVLQIDRKNVVSDAIKNLNFIRDLQRPLKVKFKDEKGVDDITLGDGALRKDFFMLFFAEILQPEFGVFEENETSKLVWFSKQPESEEIYNVIGKLCGMALYNNIIVNLNFPLVLYKKLLGEKTNFDDLKEINPEIGNSLRQVIEFEEDKDLNVEDTFCLTFITPDGIPLKKGGEDIPVTAENREEYVELYLDYFLNNSIQSQFDAFRKGFLEACDHEIMKLFRPHELMEMINGIEEFDWQSLEQVTKYEYLDCESGHFDTQHPVIKWFWEVLLSLSREEKNKFLVYLTGSNKIPLTGLHMTIVQRNECDDWMPTADVCYNRLNLHSYSRKEILEERLKRAIQCDGFHRV